MRHEYVPFLAATFESRRARFAGCLGWPRADLPAFRGKFRVVDHVAAFHDGGAEKGMSPIIVDGRRCANVPKSGDGAVIGTRCIPAKMMPSPYCDLGQFPAPTIGWHESIEHSRKRSRKPFASWLYAVAPSIRELARSHGRATWNTVDYLRARPTPKVQR